LTPRALAAAEAAPRETPPNVLLIISDDHGSSDYGFLGSPHVRTPNLDRLASQSLVFPRGYVPSSLCCPSLATIITGLYPHQHKITSNDPPAPPGTARAEFYRSKEFLDGREAMNRHLEAVPTLPRLLASRGYASLQTGKWWQGDYRRGGFTHGMTEGARHGDKGLEIGRKTLEPIREFLDAARRDGKPFFIWYAPMMPHEPHDPPERILARYRDVAPSPHLARYWAMVEWFDETCGQVLRLLEERGLAENTLVIYLADNGWTQNPDGPGSVRSKSTPYDAGLRTPILIRWPGRVSPGTSDRPVLSVDLAPTILAAAGLAPSPEMPGRNLLDAEAVGRRGAIFGECFAHDAVDLDRPGRNLLWRWAVEGRWKLIVPAGAEPPELYDVLEDPGETKDLAKERPDIVERLRRNLDAWWAPGG
ncbi:MAG: sulfatase family protein, partial [Planctomycetota bacterium]